MGIGLEGVGKYLAVFCVGFFCGCFFRFRAARKLERQQGQLLSGFGALQEAVSTAVECQIHSTNKVLRVLASGRLPPPPPSPDEMETRVHVRPSLLHDEKTTRLEFGPELFGKAEAAVR